jgi:2Fe-2S ferredoxin
MPLVKVVYPDGKTMQVSVQAGESLMRGLTGQAVAGIVAECGGSAMCATCHVYVDDPEGVLKPRDAIEEEMLNSVAAERRTTSRLSCQLQVTDAFDCLTIHIPETQ